MTLLAIAPGAEATITKPKAISGGSPLNEATVKPRIGMTVNWVKTPSRTRCGDWSVRFKSLGSSTTPSASIVAAKNQRKVSAKIRKAGGYR